jgi:protein-S-isoprenylcysteine O-methyltransferase Ste14
VTAAESASDEHGQLAAVGAAAAATGLYATLHSLLASDEAQVLVRRFFGPIADRWYRIAYNVLAIGLLVLLESFLARLPDRPIYVLPRRFQRIAQLGQLGAFAGLAACLRLTDAATFVGLRQVGLLPPFRRPLVDRGPYSLVRHPGYWCMLGIFWCKPSMTHIGLVESTVFTIYLGLGSYFEERRLVREFGDAYLAYRRRVPRLLPFRLHPSEEVHHARSDNLHSSQP